MRSKIKICGMTRIEDALLAESLGADYIGVIFSRLSPRQVTPAQARAMTDQLTTAKPIGVFVEHDLETTLRIAEAAGLSGIQHALLFDAKPGPYLYIHAQRVKDKADEAIFDDPAPDYCLFDTLAEGQHGGTGRTFDWTLIPPRHRGRSFIAGGIGPHNIGAALALHPYAVDLSSGVEASPGIKDPEKLHQLFKEARHAEQL